MRRDDIIAVLTREADGIRSFGVARVYLFGSFARDEASRDSDVDIFVDPAPNAQFSLFDRMALAEHLDAVLGRRTDVFTRRSLHRTLRASIEREAVRVI